MCLFPLMDAKRPESDRTVYKVLLRKADGSCVTPYQDAPVEFPHLYAFTNPTWNGTFDSLSLQEGAIHCFLRIEDAKALATKLSEGHYSVCDEGERIVIFSATAEHWDWIADGTQGDTAYCGIRNLTEYQECAVPSAHINYDFPM